jgi:long-chain acyl-CoA synthetase
VPDRYTPRTVPELLADRAGQEPDRLALETVGGARLTFAQWDHHATAVTSGLLERGVRPGDRVALLFDGRGWTEYAVAFCGVLRAGAVAVPCSDRWAAPQLRHVLTHSRSVALLHATGVRPPAEPGYGWSATVDELALAGAALDSVPVSPRDLAQILYTSGTTGTPKAVGASHANLTYGAAERPSRRRLRHSDVFLHSFPIGTNAGQVMLLNAIDAYPAALVLPGFTPARFLRLIETRQVGSVFLVPAMAVEMLNSPALAQHDLSAVRLLGSTAAPLPPAVAVRLTRAFPNALLVNYYTSTEAAPAQTSMIFDPARPDALGRAADGQLLIADAGRRALPAGSVGHVWLRSPFPRSYLDGEGDGTFTGGWVRMGDLGRVDDDGFLYLVDRETDIVKSGAFKVSTLQVEAALHEHPAVAEAAAVGVRHPVLGAVVGAVLVPRAGVAPDELGLAPLRHFLRDRLARHELPAHVLLAQRLPRNNAGKVLKASLVELFGER